MARLFSLLLAAVPAVGQTLIDTDFAGQWAAVRNNPRATGELPRGWVENSSWANTWIAYSRLEEDRRPFLRIQVTRHDDGACQIYYPLPRSAAGTYLRLSLTVRNPDRLPVSLGVRKLASPYTFLWQDTYVWPGGWTDHTYYVRTAPGDFDIAFFLILDSLGTLDIARFAVQATTLAAIQREFAERPAPARKNLVRNSRFPLGLQSGWTLDRDSSDEDHVRISSEGAALRIVADRRIQLYSEPVGLPQPVGRHTASVSVRGAASGVFAAMSDGAVAASRAFTIAGDDWQRLQVSFTPNVLGKAHGIRIEVQGDLLLDRLQVERSDAATEYEPPGTEVALSVDSPIRVHFENDPAIVRYATTGDAAAVRARVHDAYGRVRDVLAVNGAIRYDVFPDRPFGAFRIEAWAEDKEGQRSGPFNELVVLRLRRPHYWNTDAPESPFGTHTNSTRRHILMAKAAGINWTRLHDAGTQYIGWYHLERRPGEWTLRDDDLWRYRELGMRILGAFSTAPEWATYFDKARNGYYDRFYQPRDLDAFSTAVRLIAERYRWIIDTWDVWNEPWGAGYFAVRYDEAAGQYVTSQNPQRDFARLTRIARDAARQSDPEAKILGLNSTTGTTGTAWTQGVAAEGGLEAADAVCYHQYTGDALGFPGDTVDKGFEQAVGAVEGWGKPVWMTEGSPVYGRMRNGLYRHTVPWDEDEDSLETGDRLSRFVVGLLANGVRKVFLYSMHTHVWFGMGNAWRVLVNEDGQLHPSAAAHSAMAWFLEGARFVRREAVAEGVSGYVFESADRIVTVVAPRGPRSIPRAAGSAYYDVLGNPMPAGPIESRHVVYAVREKAPQ